MTGDIDAMWLRDSTNQVWPYLPFAKSDPALQRLLQGVINRQVHCVLADPYANAFNRVPHTSHWVLDMTTMTDDLHERKYGLDSLCAALRLSYGYWAATGDLSCFDGRWGDAMRLIIATIKHEQGPSHEEGAGPVIYWIHFTLHPAPGAAADNGGVFALPQIAAVSRSDYLAELFQRYLDDAASEHQDSLRASLLLQLMFSEVQRSQTSLTGASVPAAQAERFIRTHFHEPLTAGVVAAQVGCSPQYLSRIYRRGYGCTLTEAIQRTRVEYAYRRLHAHAEVITE